MKPRATTLAALAVALAASAAVAAESVEPVKQDGAGVRLEIPVPYVGTPRSRQAFDGLHRLRLRPGADGLDISETARKRPEPSTE